MKSKRYLVTAECLKPAPDAGGHRWTGLGWGKIPDVLPHRIHRVVNTLEQAERVGAAFQQTLMFKHECSATVEVTPVKTRKSKTPTPARLSKEAREAREEAKVIAYARWLASRDGIEIQSSYEYACKISVDWRTVYSRYRKRVRRFWNGTHEVETTYKRAAAVEWGHDESVYNTRKDGRQGAFLYRQFVCDVRIEIPNWDFEHPPIELCEETDEPKQNAPVPLSPLHTQ